jgi:hypothetical protein
VTLRRRNKTPHHLGLTHATGCKHPGLRFIYYLCQRYFAFGCSKSAQNPVGRVECFCFVDTAPSHVERHWLLSVSVTDLEWSGGSRGICAPSWCCAAWGPWVTVTPVDRMLHLTFKLETYRLIYLTRLPVTLTLFHTQSAIRLHDVER